MASGLLLCVVVITCQSMTTLEQVFLKLAELSDEHEQDHPAETSIFSKLLSCFSCGKKDRSKPAIEDIAPSFKSGDRLEENESEWDKRYPTAGIRVQFLEVLRIC